MPPIILVLVIALPVFAVILSAWLVGRFFGGLGPHKPEPRGFEVVDKSPSPSLSHVPKKEGKRADTGHVAGWFRADNPDE